VKIVNTTAEARQWRRAEAGDVGLVPTMGYLHAGHLSLVRRAHAENARVVASLFVNPRQFGPSEDFARYPRDLDRDWKLLKEAGCDVLLAPSEEEMYPAGCATFVDVGSTSQPLEGQARPGHFRGVATVVVKLLGIVQPTRAYFGQKDAQQLAVIRRAVADLNVPVEIVACPTVREADGLAMSSRNTYLSPDERRVAPVLYRALTTARDRFATGERSGDELRRAMRQVLAAEPIVHIDYVSVADPASLQELATASGGALLSLAVRLGTTRLIDNLVVSD
jgi:pantoate--beta-alanine ligase